MVFKPGESGNPGGKWKPGQSGNPKGRPSTKPFRDMLKRISEQLNADEEIGKALISKAMMGDVSAIKEYADRTDGKIPQAIGGTDDLPPIKGFAWIDPTTE